jgi:hypothetical protein
MNPYSNSRKNRFFDRIPRTELDSPSCNIASRSKFNFSYVDESQEAGQIIVQWDERNLQQLIKKLQDYTRESLRYWQQQTVGSHRHHVLEIYGDFPKNSAFFHPKHVPVDVHWGRFRINSSIRLVGFVVPGHMDGCISKCRDYLYDGNTFYVVFLDVEHRFYQFT